jgi:hypothetical protein
MLTLGSRGVNDPVNSLKTMLTLGNRGANDSVNSLKTKPNSVALVRERSISTDRTSLAGEVNANFYG